MNETQRKTNHDKATKAVLDLCGPTVREMDGYTTWTAGEIAKAVLDAITDNSPTSE